MTNKEFVEYCRIGDLAKVTEGVHDKTVKHDIWGSKALVNAHNSIVSEKRDIVRMSKVIDLLIQNTNVDPSVDIFILPWAIKKCEYKTIEMIIHHKNVIHNPDVFRQSGMMGSNAFDRPDATKVLDLLLTNPLFSVKEVFKLASWGTILELMMWCIHNNNDYSNVYEYVERVLYKLVTDDINDIKHEAFVKLYKDSDFPRSYNENYYPIISQHLGDTSLVTWFKEDPEVIEVAIKKQQYELFDKDAVDIFIF